MRTMVRNILGGLAATLMLAGVGLTATATAADASAFHLIKNSGSSLCLQPEGGSTAETAAIVQMPCDRNNAAQGWLEQRVGSHHYMFLNQASGFCFDAFGGAVNGTRLLQGECKRISNEEYNTNVDLPNVTILESRIGFRDTGFCVDVPGGRADVGLAMQIFRCNGTPAQRWVVGFDL
ncbi:RICIN domain-containing protein [Amycolatopsis sp. H20-H5]|uniref:RICIN domain-containing protein n=1 Tax=Amycolatopsis sp. H20-H5 TaxID=3046309 RepID=UPI002DBF1D9E|nr:RICIN domain-containing protein [Amycolatopsis sp. H20-H5]MEC3982703.1 RICIN domain-containing protein [Amycolatopsis sp. H20-H5]